MATIQEKDQTIVWLAETLHTTEAERDNYRWAYQNELERNKKLEEERNQYYHDLSKLEFEMKKLQEEVG